MGRPQSGDEPQLTAVEVAAILRVHRQTVARLAARTGIGVNLHGSAGWRFTRVEVEQLRDSLRPTAATAAARDPRSRKRGVHA